LAGDHDPGLIPHCEKYWGPEYFMHQANQDAPKVLNYFVSEVAKVSSYAFVFARNIGLYLKDKPPKDREAEFKEYGSIHEKYC
jgi:hypothetical protein